MDTSTHRCTTCYVGYPKQNDKYVEDIMANLSVLLGAGADPFTVELGRDNDERCINRVMTPTVFVQAMDLEDYWAAVLREKGYTLEQVKSLTRENGYYYNLEQVCRDLPALFLTRYFLSQSPPFSSRQREPKVPTST